MAVTSLTEIGRRSTDALDGRGVPVREHLVIYQALTDGAGTDAELVLAHPALPGVGDFYETPERVKNRACRCISREPENDPDAPFKWVIQCKFSTQWPSVDPVTANANPLLRPPTITRDLKTSREVVTVDLFGDALATSADEPYDPPQTRDAHSRVINYEFNVPKFDEVEFDRDYLNKTNSKPWRGYPAYTVKIDGASSQTQTEQGKTYDRVRLALSVKFGQRIVKFPGLEHIGGAAAGRFKIPWQIVERDPDDPDAEDPAGMEWSAWDLLMLDSGYRVAQNPATFVRGDPTMHAEDAAGVKVAKPILLDGQGLALSSSALADKTTPRYHRYWLYDVVDFAELGLT